MSPASDQQFNTWFPAVVLGLVIGILAAALWDVIRRKTWLFASRFWPGVLKEVGLDHPGVSRSEVEEKQREVTEMLSAISSQISSGRVAGTSSDFDIEAQTGFNPVYTSTLKPITFTATAYFPDGTPNFLLHRTKVLFGRYARGPVKRSKSSTILHAALPVDPWVLAEIGELAKNCLYIENKCTFQFGNWAIMYHNADEVHLRVLTEGEVPVNVEARWQGDGTGITMYGLYLNGAQVKVATKRTCTTLRSAGPAVRGYGDLDELHFPTAGLDIPGDDPLIYAAKVVEAGIGISLIVRSEANFILHSREKSLREVTIGLLQWMSLSAKNMFKELLKYEDRQPENSRRGPDLDFNFAHFELLAEYWKGVSVVELLENRKKVLNYLQELSVSGIVECTDSQLSHFPNLFIGDQFYFKYWQRGLEDVNEVILLMNSPKNINGPQSGTHLSIRGGIKFLLGDFEGALQDFDLAYKLNPEGHRSTLLLDRALTKCMLSKYSDAMEDVLAIIVINPDLNYVQELQILLHQLLYQLTVGRTQYSSLNQGPQHVDLQGNVPTILDLLTGHEWHSSESVRVSDVSTPADDSKEDSSSMNPGVIYFQANWSAPPERLRNPSDLNGISCDMWEKIYGRTYEDAETIMSDSRDSCDIHTAFEGLLPWTDEVAIMDSSGADRALTPGRPEYFSSRTDGIVCKFPDYEMHGLCPKSDLACASLEDGWGPRVMQFDPDSVTVKEFLMMDKAGLTEHIPTVPLSGPFPLRQSRDIMLRHIAQGLICVHSSAFAHPDLEASNILLHAETDSIPTQLKTADSSLTESKCLDWESDERYNANISSTLFLQVPEALRAGGRTQDCDETQVPWERRDAMELRDAMGTQRCDGNSEMLRERRDAKGTQRCDGNSEMRWEHINVVENRPVINTDMWLNR
ncbi:hypothetical protein KC19_4G046500 [Ceratodon purpureus]|uniref:Protein kinase domain-containing protein n=1 Tax=Ceratodon purpureus TaxID=3225 RepID=A0A8T0I6L0_CERPU|nr:hypothetical protein KC19_4G046500 [Ceratodon purpureus]